MSLLGSFGFKDTLAANPDQREMLSLYKRYRQVLRGMNDLLVSRLSREELQRGAKKLGMLRGGTFVFDNEDQSCVLMDYCLYDVRTQGRSAVERYLLDSSDDPESDKMVCLRAMQHAFYSLFLVESTQPGVCLMARDLLSRETYQIVDMGLSKTGKAGLVFAGRLIQFDTFAMTSGAVLPLGVLPLEEVEEKLLKQYGKTSASNPQFDPAGIIRQCIEEGSSDHIRYEGFSGRQSIPSGRSLGPASSAKVGRNEKCPCGSGRKFKNCCLQR